MRHAVDLVAAITVIHGSHTGIVLKIDFRKWGIQIKLNSVPLCGGFVAILSVLN